MDTSDNHSIWIFPLSMHLQFMGCSLMAPNYSNQTWICAAWMHEFASIWNLILHVLKPHFDVHAYNLWILSPLSSTYLITAKKPLTTNCVWGSGSKTRLVLGILHVKVHLLSQIMPTHPLSNYNGVIFFRLTNDQNYIVAFPLFLNYTIHITHVS